MRIFVFLSAVAMTIQAIEPCKDAFKGWKQKPLELISLFLPPSPLILHGGELADLSEDLLQWPESRTFSLDTIAFMGSTPIDLIRLSGNGLQFLSAETLKDSRVIYVDQLSFQYNGLRELFEQNGFKPLCQWEQGKVQEAVFVKSDFYCNQDTLSYLSSNFVGEDAYKKYFVPEFGVYYYLDDDGDSIKASLRRGEAYEKDIGHLIQKLAKKESLVIDVGAHIGVHTITMSKKVGPKGAVIAFEPHKKFYMELRSNLELNDCDNVIPIAKGLGENAKKALLKNIKIEEGKFNIQAEDSLDSIDLIPLDSLNLDNLSLIKMDVENYEYFVLKGAEKTILRNQPVLIFECWIGRDYEKSDPKEKANFDRVMALLEAYDYEVYVIYSNDFIAFPPDLFGQWAEVKTTLRRLDLKHFDLGLR